MFTKLEQRSWIKIKVARCRSTQECFQGLCEALCGTDPGTHRCRCHGPFAPLEIRRFWNIHRTPDISPCGYDLFAKVKEPLRGTRCNTIDEIIGVIGWSIRNIVKDWRAYGVRRLSNICKKVINKGAKVHKCCIPVNKAMTKIFNCCHYFLSHHYSYPEVTRLC